MSALATPRSTAFPFLERPIPAVLLAVISGLLNAWTYMQVQAFATVQSGNIVTIGYALGQHDWQRTAIALASIAAFSAGAATCAVAVALIQKAAHEYSVAVLVFEGCALAVCTVASVFGTSATVIALVISFLAGIQGNAFHREAGMLYGNVAVTFVVQSVGSLLGRAAVFRVAPDGQPHLGPAGEYFVVLVGFAAGGAAGFALSSLWTSGALAAAAALLLGLAVAGGLTRGAIDPSQNNPTP